MERPEIIEILVQSLHSPPADEQRVAYAFLREVVVRPGEPFAHRARALLHLLFYRTKQTALLARKLPSTAASFIPNMHRRKEAPADSVWDFSLEACRTGRRFVLFALIVAANAYFWLREALTASIAAAARRASRVGDTLVDACGGLLAAGFCVGLRTSSVFTGIHAGILAAVMAARTMIFGAAASARSRLERIHDGVRRVVSDSRSRIGRAARSYEARIAYAVDRKRLSLVARYTRARGTLFHLVASVAGGITHARLTIVGRYMRARDGLFLFVNRIAEAVRSAHRVVVAVFAEIKRHATRQVLPEGATPLVAAGLVCLVLFVFGINSYFIVSDQDRKGIFIDLSRYEWGDEALASMLIGEGYDIYLQEKITEKKIKELLATGKYYERVIRVTGYYSPLPDQEKYATGSYRGDIILNGRGIMGSDTTPVYMGMAAGPPHLEYGTNVIIEDLGKFDLPKVYTVHDRGGAINGNRLDIWVGKGEEAMKKAYEITGYYKVIVVGDK